MGRKLLETTLQDQYFQVDKQNMHNIFDTFSFAESMKFKTMPSNFATIVILTKKECLQNHIPISTDNEDVRTTISPVSRKS